MDDIETALSDILRAVNRLQNHLKPLDKFFQDCGFKPLAECGISEKVKMAKLIIASRNNK